MVPISVELGSAFISVGLSTKGLGGDIKKAFGGADGAGADAGKRAGKGFGMGFAGIAASAIGALGIGTFLKGAVSEASGLGESINAVNVVFGKASKGVQQLGKESAKSLGLSNLEFNNLAVRFSSFAGSIAGPGGDVTGTLKAMTGRAADFASVMNLDVAEAAELFQSGLAGESEPLRAFGIDLSAAAVEAFALKEGIATSAGSMTEAEKVQARYGLLMQETSKTQGDFANTSGSLANQQRILSSSWKNTQAAIGTLFLPTLEKVVGFINASVMPNIDKLVATLGSGGLAGAFTKIIDGSAGMRDQLITSIATAIPGVIQAIVAAAPAILVAAVRSFSSLVTAVTTSIPPLLTALLGMMPQIITTLLGMVPMLITAGLQLFQGIVQAVILVLPQIVSALTAALPQIAAAILSMLPQIVSAGLGMFMGIVKAVLKLLPILIDAVMGLLPVLISTLLGMLPQIIDSGLKLFLGVVTGLLRAAPTIIKSLLGMLPQIITTLLGMIPQLIQAAVQLFNGLARALPIILPQLIAALLDIAPVIVSTLIGMVPMLFTVGQQIIQGLIDGVGSMIGSAVQAVKDIGGSMLSGIQDFLGIKSPSRVFKAEVGMMIGAGLIQGLDASQRGVAASVNRLVPIPSVSAYRAGAYSPAGSAAGASGGGVVNFYGNVGWDADRVAQEIEVRKRRSQTMAGMGGVVFA